MSNGGEKGTTMEPVVEVPQSEEQELQQGIENGTLEVRCFPLSKIWGRSSLNPCSYPPS